MMPEKEHRLDGLLRTWARQRRDAITRGFDLEPSRRRLLLAEVQRCFPEREKDRVPWRVLLNLWWTRTIGAAGLVALLIVAGWSFRVAWRNLPQAGDIALVEANPPAKMFTLSRTSTNRFVDVFASQDARSAPEDDLARFGSLQASNVAKLALLTPARPAADLRRGRAAPVALSGPTTETRPPPPSSLPDEDLSDNRASGSAAKVFSALGGQTKEPTVRINSENLGSLPQEIEPRSNLASALESKPTPADTVLVQFHIKRQGQEVSLVDHDGSEYRGAILDSTLSKPARVSTLLKEASPSVLSFRVSGTNRTLNQPVAFEGTLREPATTLEFSGASLATNGVELARKKMETTPPPTLAPQPTTSLSVLPVTRAETSSRGQPVATASKMGNSVFLQGRLRVGSSAERTIEAIQKP